MYCYYYQAIVEPKNVWFFVATLRSFEHITFDRTLNKENSIFEFFVPQDLADRFESVMQIYITDNIVSEFKKLPNRLLDPNEKL